MNADFHNDPHLDDKDPVWQLLARAPRPEPDGWFTARTMAACRQTTTRRGFAAIGHIWRWALGGGIGVCLAMILVIHSTSAPHSSVSDDQSSVQEAFEIVASVPADSDSSSSTSWKDSSL